MISVQTNSISTAAGLGVKKTEDEIMVGGAAGEEGGQRGRISTRGQPEHVEEVR